MKKMREKCPWNERVLMSSLKGSPTLGPTGGIMNNEIYSINKADNVIGRSIDIFGNYLEPDSRGIPILNMDHLDTREFEVGNKSITCPILSRLHFRGNDVTNVNIKVDTDMYSYSRSFEFSKTIGGSYKIFSGSIGAAVGHESSTWTRSKYATGTYKADLGTFYLDLRDMDGWLDDDEMRSLFTDSFRNDLMNKNPAQFFSEYNTHFASQFRLGGHCGVTYTSTAVGESTAWNMKGSVEGAITELEGCVGGEQTAEWEKIMSGVNVEFTLHFECYGGDSELCKRDPKAWITSVRNSPTHIAFGSDIDLPDSPDYYNGLVPVWALLPKGSARRNALEAEFELVLERNKKLMAEFCSWVNYSKEDLELGLGDYPGLGKDDGYIMNWSSEIDGFKIPKGLKVTAWGGRNFTGTQYGPFEAKTGPVRTPKLSDDEGINKWQSIKVEKA